MPVGATTLPSCLQQQPEGSEIVAGHGGVVGVVAVGEMAVEVAFRAVAAPVPFQEVMEIGAGPAVDGSPQRPCRWE